MIGKSTGEIEILNHFARQYGDELPTGHELDVASTFQISWQLAADPARDILRAMAELARGIDGLVKHIRAEQADLRIHIEEQGDTNKKLRELIEAMLREDASNGTRPN